MYRHLVNEITDLHLVIMWPFSIDLQSSPGTVLSLICVIRRFVSFCSIVCSVMYFIVHAAFLCIKLMMMMMMKRAKNIRLEFGLES